MEMVDMVALPMYMGLWLKPVSLV